MVIEIHLDNFTFILADDALNSGDLFGWVKRVIVSEVISSSLARLTITESETDCVKRIPFHFRDSQSSEFLQTDLGKRCHVWN